MSPTPLELAERVEETGLEEGAEPAAFLDGKTVRLTGVDAAAKVTLTNNDAAGGVLFNGGSVELGLFDSVALEYYLAQDRWIELGRNS